MSELTAAEWEDEWWAEVERARRITAPDDGDAAALYRAAGGSTVVVQPQRGWLRRALDRVFG